MDKIPNIRQLWRSSERTKYVSEETKYVRDHYRYNHQYYCIYLPLFFSSKKVTTTETMIVTISHIKNTMIRPYLNNYHIKGLVRRA